MAGSNRDNFSSKTIKALGLRANHRCSFPGCGSPTSGPSDESPIAYVNIGIAAHIHGAAPGSRRYLLSMTPEQRSHIKNGIWLCANHSTEIDRDEMRYTADVLHKMKLDHENQVSFELSGSKPRMDTDFVALGQDLVFTGEVIGTVECEWQLRIDHFLIGNLSTLIKFSERFDNIDRYDRYVLVNALGDGRQLAAAPVWQKTDTGYIISCRVLKSFPRISAHNIPTDIALSDAHDIFITNDGDFATVSGLAALPQMIKVCLSTFRGDMQFNPTLGTRIKEYFDLFQDSPWLLRLIKLEVIRQACIPYYDSITKQDCTPLQSVLRVHSIEQLPSEQNTNWLPFSFLLEVDGVGSWQHDIPIFVPTNAPGLADGAVLIDQ